MDGTTERAKKTGRTEWQTTLLLHIGRTLPEAAETGSPALLYRPHRPCRTRWRDWHNRSHRACRCYRSDRKHRRDRPDRNNRPHRTDRTDRPHRSDRSNWPDRPGRRDRTDGA